MENLEIMPNENDDSFGERIASLETLCQSFEKTLSSLSSNLGTIENRLRDIERSTDKISNTLNRFENNQENKSKERRTSWQVWASIAIALINGIIAIFLGVLK